VLPPAITFSESAPKFFKVTLILKLNGRKLLHNYLVIVGLLAMIFSFIAAVSVVVSEADGMPLTKILYIRISIYNIIIFMGFSCVWYVVFALSGAY
jgi:hypothetical protein